MFELCQPPKKKKIISLLFVCEGVICFFAGYGVHTLYMFVTECSLTHIGKLDGALGAGVHKLIATDGVKFGCGDDLGEFLHICRFDIHDIETLVLDVKIPQIHSKIVTADKGFAITIHGDAIYMIRVGIGVGPSWNGSDHGIVVCQTG